MCAVIGSNATGWGDIARARARARVARLRFASLQGERVSHRLTLKLVPNAEHVPSAAPLVAAPDLVRDRRSLSRHFASFEAASRRPARRGRWRSKCCVSSSSSARGAAGHTVGARMCLALLGADGAGGARAACLARRLLLGVELGDELDDLRLDLVAHAAVPGARGAEVAQRTVPTRDGEDAPPRRCRRGWAEGGAQSRG